MHYDVCIIVKDDASMQSGFTGKLFCALDWSCLV